MVPAVLIATLEILIGVLSNQVTTAGWAVLIAFGVVAVLLVTAVAFSVVRPEWRSPDSVMRRVIRGRWGPAVLLTSVTWIGLSVALFAMRGSSGPPPEPGGTPAASPAISHPATANPAGDVLFDDFEGGLDLVHTWNRSSTADARSPVAEQIYVRAGKLHLEVTPANSAYGVNASLYPRLPVETPLRKLSFTMVLVSQEGHSDGSANVIISSLQRREHRIWAGPGDSKPTLGYQICRSGQCTDGDGDIDNIDFAAEKGREVQVQVEVVDDDRMRFSMDGYQTVETASDPEPLSTFLFYVWSDAGRSYHVTIDDVRIGY